MTINLARAVLVAGVVALSVPMTGAPVLSAGTLRSEKATDNVTIVSFGDTRIHTFHGVSNSHIIETTNELRVIDAQFLAHHAEGLRVYIESLGKPLAQIVLSHNHPDHWFGARIIADLAPVATSENIAADLKSGGGRYIEIIAKNPKMKDSVPAEVIVPSQVIELGAQSWDGLNVVVEEYAEQESHHSLLIKIPEAGIMIGQDLFYNGFFLVASERERNANWRDLLQSLSDKEAKEYQTLLVGHGANGGPSILTQDIAYLDALEQTLSKNLNQEETANSLIAQFPDKKGADSFLGISMRNLFKGH